MVVKQITASNADEKIKQLYDMQLEVLKYKKVPHLEGLSSNYSKLFRVVYKGLLAHAEVGEDVL